MKQFVSAMKQIAEEKGIPQDTVFETVEAALAAAYKRDYGKKGQIIKVKLDADSGSVVITQTHYVVEGVDEEGYITGVLPEQITQDRADIVDIQRQREAGQAPTSDTEITEEGHVRAKFNPEKHITLEDAKKKQPDVQVGDEIITPLEAKSDFGRIAAQTAKQVVIQRLREAERASVLAEYKGKEGGLVSGLVQRREGPLVFIDLGKTNGILPVSEQMPGDHYRIGQRFRFYILKVEDAARGPVIVLSRAHSNLVQELFRMEVPEIDSGAVKIMGVAREPGSRTKISVTGTEEGVDPIGSLVGQRGVRVQTVINDLGGEKIDIIQYDEDPIRYIANALSPAKILQVTLTDQEHKVALAEVADDQFSLAIGKGGQNVRLAARLTGWKIDVRSPREEATSEEATGEKVSDQDDIGQGERSPEESAPTPKDEQEAPVLEETQNDEG